MEISSRPLRLCGSRETRAGAGAGFLRDGGAPSTFGAGSLRSGGRDRFWRWEWRLGVELRLRPGPQSSFLLLSVLCTEAKKSTRSLAVFLGLSITTEWPQFSRSSTWELAIDLANTSAPDTSSTCRTREETGWKGFRCPNALHGQNSRPGLAGVIFRTKPLWCWGLWLSGGSDHVPHVLLCSSVLGGMLLQCCRAGNTGLALRMPWYGGEARLESRQVQRKVAKTLMGENELRAHPGS